ncbi:MAG: 4-hydroxy-tetrahydrodipicolinate reductase [Acidiferrobacter sp.]
MKIAIAGVAGRMGRALVAAIAAAADLTLVGALVRPKDPSCAIDVGVLVGGAPCGVCVSDDAAAVIAACDVLIDFTNPAASLHHAALCAAVGRPVVIGTTGLAPATVDQLRDMSTRTAMMVAANMSVGVALALHLLAIAGRVLGDADVEIIDVHHRHKVDAPSGTALRMGEVIAQARNQTLAECAVYDRHSHPRSRVDGSIGFASLRAGEIVGEHRVVMALPSERLEIAHVADSRQVFADGALRAARFISGRSCGLFDMQDVLGLR